ncbi:MAG: putative Ig domain-containing protein [Woeseiaceae bacterium]|nr:putative Ig domain-containing protein [Woeseiaceae bacterium]
MTARPIINTFRVLLFLPVMLGMAGCLSKESSGSDGGSNQSSLPAGTPSPANSAPTISGNPPGSVSVERAFVFTPTATDPDGDALTFSVSGLPSWAEFDSSSGLISGVPGPGDVGVYSGISVRVSDGSLSATLPSFSIEVIAQGAATGSATLTWVAPTVNEDGSALTDLAGFRVYYGRRPGGFTNSVTLDDPGATTVVISDLPSGEYEFVATAFNEAGIESAFSSPATKIIP